MAVVAGIVAVTAAVAAGVVGAMGAEQEAGAQAEAANYRASIAAQNEQIAHENARRETAKGEAETYQQQQKTRAVVGATVAQQGASGIDPNTGSAKDVQLSERAVGMSDALTVRKDAAMQAYGYETQAANFQGERALYKMEAKNAKKAGDINALSSLLGGIGGGASKGYSMGLF